MDAMASQITSLTIVYSTVYSGADRRKYKSSASMAFVRGIHRWPASNTETVSIWWRHHGKRWTQVDIIICVLFQLWSSHNYSLTLNLDRLGAGLLVKNRLLSWLVMNGFLASPSHLQPWYSQYDIDRPLFHEKIVYGLCLSRVWGIVYDINTNLYLSRFT